MAPKLIYYGSVALLLFCSQVLGNTYPIDISSDGGYDFLIAIDDNVAESGDILQTIKVSYKSKPGCI